jgi:hypothetical protein
VASNWGHTDVRVSPVMVAVSENELIVDYCLVLQLQLQKLL